MDLTYIGGQHRPIVAERHRNGGDARSAKQERDGLCFAFARDQGLEMPLLLLADLSNEHPTGLHLHRKGALRGGTNLHHARLHRPLHAIPCAKLSRRFLFHRLRERLLIRLGGHGDPVTLLAHHDAYVRGFGSCRMIGVYALHTLMWDKQCFMALHLSCERRLNALS